ncbi:MAG: ADP-heptose--LPS heptosyltransferase [Verrucomicrobiae bacterium]|nr:ADP-heptose--LPS heptosyltransferase [Verrucomicrobiae bacterium]
MRAVILRNHLAPGDNIVLTAALRDFQRLYPGEFAFDVRCPCPDIWLNNPHLTALTDQDPSVESLDLQCPLIQWSNRRPCHFLEGFGNYMGFVLDREFQLTEFRGDIHLTPFEQARPSRVAHLLGADLPFWLVAAGGKFDITAKWWSYRRYQQVIDHFQDRILFVQAGELGNYHPPLRGVLDLRGTTTLRELILLMRHAEGVLCGITSLMHLAAAVPTRPDRPTLRPCVVVAGAREPLHWEAYPGHQFLHTIGSLPCCAEGACWRSRTLPLHDDDENDAPERLCLDVHGDLPRCMHLISAHDVIRAIERYLEGGAARCLTPPQASLARPHLRSEVPAPYA